MERREPAASRSPATGLVSQRRLSGRYSQELKRRLQWLRLDVLEAWTVSQSGANATWRGELDREGRLHREPWKAPLDFFNTILIEGECTHLITLEAALTLTSAT